MIFGLKTKLFRRRSVSRDGAQHSVPGDVHFRGEPGEVRRAPRVAGHGEHADWPSGAHRRPRFRPFHREVPAGCWSEVLQIRNGLPGDWKDEPRHGKTGRGERR